MTCTEHGMKELDEYFPIFVALLKSTKPPVVAEFKWIVCKAVILSLKRSNCAASATVEAARAWT